MAEPEAEAAWRAELERIGETQPREAQNSDGKLKRQRRLQEEHARHYVRWTLFAAIGAVIAGLIAEGLTLLH